MLAEVKILRLFAIPILLVFASCGMEDPQGSYKGYVKDWVYEVFDGTLTEGGKTNGLQVVLRQTPEGMLAEIRLSPPGKEDILRMGKWEVGDGERVLRFSDGKTPSECFLIKRGARFAFQSKEGITNDDGSLVLLMRNEGLSRKESFPFSLNFIDSEEVYVRGGGDMSDLKGEWKWADGRVVVVVELPPEEGADTEQSSESYKYFLRWSDSGSALELEKMVVLRPFTKKDGAKRKKRQSWMSSLIFPDPPKLKPN